MRRAYYVSSIDEFCKQDSSHILGCMIHEHAFDLTPSQRNAWVEQTTILQNVLWKYRGRIYFEYSIPRMGRRIDAVVIIQSVIFILEFKVGASTYESADLDQVMDYALDLHNFHEGSHQATIVPILIATKAPNISLGLDVRPTNNLFHPICCNGENVGNAIEKLLNQQLGSPIELDVWERSGYKPTPTIIEATLALYNGHSVEDISRSDACARNLSQTSSAVAEVIKISRDRNEKSIVLVTGVPGAGKTLVGLNIATTHINPNDELYSVYLSGNGPLVKILQEALARDKVAQQRDVGKKIRKGDALSEVKAFIQNVHHFRDEGLLDLAKPPVEHVVLFDEAQRAWTKDQTVKFMREKKNQENFKQSEPEFLISCMDRHPDWAAVVCLVGGGQEINTGEAGIQEWLEAIETSFADWKVYISDRLSDSEYGAGEILDRAKQNANVTFLPELHLKTSVRSFRSEKVSLFVKQLLDIETEAARSSLLEIQKNFPIVLTRDLSEAKAWVRKQARGSERYGMV
ncbi:MAG: DNA/RNA helicase domain-containing protein, partial [Gammaproteobacteria bacterium]